MVQPLAISTVNWKALQKVMPQSNCLSEIKNAGLSPNDPAALAFVLTHRNDIRDSWVLRFILIQFIVTVKAWDNTPMLLDQHLVSKDEEGCTIVLSGTADKWRIQINEELKSFSTESRVKVFNECLNYINATGLKSIFKDVTKVRNPSNPTVYLIK